MSGRVLDMDQVRQQLSSLELGSPLVQGNLTVIPLFSGARSELNYLLMDEAISQEVLAVTELEQGGSVPELHAANLGDPMILLVEGEQLRGAKQNRTLNLTVLMAGRSEVVIPVSCSEAHRWQTVSYRFRTSGHHAHPELRRQKSRSVSESLRRGRGHRSDQMAVWNEVQRISCCLHAISPTSDYEAVYEQAGREASEWAESLRPPADAVGVVVGLSGRPEMVDIFDKPATLQRLWGKLCGGYVVGAMSCAGRTDTAAPMAVADARDFLARAARSSMQANSSPGVAADVRIMEPDLQGAAAVYEGIAVHVALFSS